MSVHTRFGFVLVCLTAITLTACDQVDPTTPGYWISKLETKARGAAAKKLGEMDAKEAVEPLIKAYDDGRGRKAIVTALAKLGDKKAKGVLVEAVGDLDNPKTAQLAAATLKEWGVEQGDAATFVQVIANPKSPKENTFAALELLTMVPDQAALPHLMRIVQGDPDLQPIVLNGLAAETLGKLGATQAIDPLIRCLWLDDALGRNAVNQCRLALNRIGPKAVVPQLLNTMARKNPIVEKRAKKNRYDKGGTVEFKMAEMLGDMPDASAIDPLVKAMTQWEELPPDLANNERRAMAFIKARIQKVISSASALAAIGDASAVKPMLKLASAEDIALEYKNATVQQLAFLGSSKAIPGLVKIMSKKSEMHHYTSHGFQLQAAIAAGRLIDSGAKRDAAKLKKAVAKRSKEFRKWVATSQKKLDKAKAAKKLPEQKEYTRDIKHYSEMVKAYDEVEATITAAEACGDSADCWGSKLAEKSVPVRLMAAYRLAQAKGDQRATAKKHLLKFAGDEDLTVRNVILFALRRTGDKSVVPTLESYRKADETKGKTDKRFVPAAKALELTIAQMKHL